MSEQIRETLSALMDNEANELELQRVLSQSQQAELRHTWARYQLARRALHGDAGQATPGLDISGEVRAAIAAEESAAAPAPSTPADGPRNWSFWRPAASFAVAASVFAAVLVGSQLYGLMGTGSAQVAGAPGRVATVGMVNSVGGAALNATYGSPAIKSTAVNQRAAYDQLARKRLQRYILPHTDETVLNSAQGMMPYARLASFQRQE